MAAPVVGHRKVVEMTLDSGETVLVTKLSARFLTAVRREVEPAFPPVDRAAYEEPLEGALLESQMHMPREQELAYNAAVMARQMAINNAVSHRWAACAVNVPRGRERAIADYAEIVAEMRRYAGLPDDAWEATLNFCILETPRDMNRVYGVAIRELPVEEAEIREGMYLFRDHLPEPQPLGHRRDAAGDAAGHESAPGAPEAE
jgi:hypothetical protein